MSAHANSSLPPPDSVFPDWQSIEIFGVPGAGKSYYCRNLVRSAGVFSTCDDQIARHYIDRRFNPAERLLRAVTPERVFKNYYRLKMNRIVRNFLSERSGPIDAYLASVEAAIGQADLSAGTEKNIRDSVRRTAAYLSLAEHDRHKIVVDEGLLRKLSTIMARSGADAISAGLRDAIRRCLRAYPWQKNALLLETAKPAALQRQHGRGHVISTAEKPIDDFFGAVELLSDLLQQSGWRLARMRND